MNNPKEIEVELVRLVPSYTQRIQFADEANQDDYVHGLGSGRLERYLTEMGIAVAGDAERLSGEPFPIHYAMAIAPLVHPK